ncbi:MAG: GPW/gp25 family protein [Anaerolineae bacterium]|nr:MAG: GPW/gp25 family protein [Anaerolineae bacterium]
MTVGRLLGRGISFPPRIGPDGRMVWSEGEANIREAIYVILMTQFNERINQADYGGNLPAYLFEPNTVTTRHQVQARIEEALRRWEPRIAVQTVEVVPDPDDPLAGIATITYRLVATQAVSQVQFGITLGAG